MKSTVLLSGLVAGGLVAGVAGADVIRLRNGNALQGDALVLPNGDVEVYSAMGMWTVKASRVLEVVQSESTEERVATALARRPALSPQELFDLALDIRDEGAVTLSHRLLERVVAVDPDHEEARRLLGQRRLGESWVSEEEYRVANGEVRYRGEWTDAEAAARTLELEALEAMRERAQAARRLQDAQLELVYQERFLRLQQLEQMERQASYGIPLDGLWGFAGVPVFPVVTPFQPHPGQHDGRPGVSPRSPRPMPEPQPPMVAPQHNRSSLRRAGG